MTLLVAWVSKDNKPTGKEVSALYIASDSRYSWSASRTKYDNGPKTFACVNFPEIFGFCGDVSFCTTVISHLKNLVDTNCLFNSEESIESKFSKIGSVIETSIRSYPTGNLGCFTILYGTRSNCQFGLCAYSFSKKDGFIRECPSFPEDSNQIFIGGSGGKFFLDRWIEADNPKKNNARTARNIYHCLSETIRNSSDPATGGHPQVVGIYRGGNGRIFGTIQGEKRIILGLEQDYRPEMGNIEWRNDEFERINVETLNIEDNAQRHYF